MNKNIITTYLAAVGLGAVLIASGMIPAGTALPLFGFGAWFPVFAAFVGSCIETKTRRLTARPAASGVSAAVAVAGLVWADLGTERVKGTAWMAGLGYAVMRFVFVPMLVVSVIIGIAMIIRSCVIKSKSYDGFRSGDTKLAMKTWQIVLISFISAIILAAAVFFMGMAS